MATLPKRVIVPNPARGLLLCLVAALTGCQPGWVRIDGNLTETSELESARQTCQIDTRLAELERARAANAAEAARAGSNDNRMLRIDDFETQSFSVYEDIDRCMREQGYRRAGSAE